MIKLITAQIHLSIRVPKTKKGGTLCISVPSFFIAKKRSDRQNGEVLPVLLDAVPSYEWGE